MKFKQQPRSVLMVRPTSFGFNPQTAESNVFQKAETRSSQEEAINSLGEFDRMVDLLVSHEIDVKVFPDTETPIKPDAIFPNNWISFHEDGTVVLYPMMAENRRSERRLDILEQLRNDFNIGRVIDLSDEESRGIYLEGTGSIVFDHVNKIAYACRSVRMNEDLLKRLCKELHYKPIVFDSVDENHKPVYHTNVMMCIAEKFAVICLDSIKNENDQEVLLGSFSDTGHKVIAISYDQMTAFSGNLIEVMTTCGETLVILSETALKTLLPGQINAINQFSEILPVGVSTIEKLGGGSVRCMVAGIHLPVRKGD